MGEDAGRGTPRTDRELLRRAWHLVAGHRGAVGMLLLLELVATPLYLLAPVPLKLAIDSVIGEDPLPTAFAALVPDRLADTEGGRLGAVVVLQVVVVLLIQLLNATVLVLQRRTGQRLTLGLRERLFRHVQRLSFSYLDRHGSADTVYRVQYDTPAIENLAVHAVVPFVGSVVTLVSMAFVLGSIDVGLAVVALAVAPVLLVLMRGYKLRMRDRYTDARQLESDALHVVQETLGAFRVVKAFGREDEHTRRFGRHSTDSISANVGLARAEGGYGLAVQLTTGVGTAVVLLLGVQDVLAGTLTLGELTLVMAYLVQLFAPVQAISQITASLQGYLASLERVFEVLDEQPDVVERPDALAVDRVRGEIEVQGLRFGYDHEPVLRDVCFSVPAGARVGVVGRTGAGKTTLLGLLMRLRDPGAGRITLDGVDLRDLRLADLREQFAVVLQDSVLFSTSIAENIGYGRPGATTAEIVEAATLAGAHDFISALPAGYDTVVGERGMRLSGGERQRVALARAFVKDAPILFLDEPTSAVDRDTEATIMEAMLRLMEGRTTFMIAHRTSTLEVCDRLLRVVDGTVRELPRSALPAPGDDRASSRSTVPHVPPADDELAAGLEAVLPAAMTSGGRPSRAQVQVLGRRADPWAVGAAELVSVRRGPDRHELRVAYRDGRPSGRQREHYEVVAHRELLGASDLLLPRFHGVHVDARSGSRWVVTEHPHDSWRLDEVATGDAMRTAAVWLAELHRVTEIRGVDELPPLRRRRAEELVALAETAARASREQGVRVHWVPRLCRALADDAAWLVSPPVSILVGAAHPGNLLVHDDHVLPIDLSAAAVGPGELDLAQLLDGWPAAVVQDCTADYRRLRWPDGPADRFPRRLVLARSLTHVHWLTEIDDWRVPDAQWRLDHLLELGRELGVVDRP